MKPYKVWSALNPGDLKRKDKIHPADREAFRRLDKHPFDLTCLPGSFAGPLNKAKLILLYSSPGLAPEDLEEAKSPQRGIDHLKQMATGTRSFYQDNSAALTWWKSRLEPFGGFEALKGRAAILVS